MTDQEFNQWSLGHIWTDWPTKFERRMEIAEHLGFDTSVARARHEKRLKAYWRRCDRRTLMIRRKRGERIPPFSRARLGELMRESFGGLVSDPINQRVCILDLMEKLGDVPHDNR